MKTQYNKSHRMTVIGDLDGRTVAQIREMLSQYPDDAVVESYTDLGQTVTEDIECFHIVWNRG